MYRVKRTPQYFAGELNPIGPHYVTAGEAGQVDGLSGSAAPAEFETRAEAEAYIEWEENLIYREEPGEAGRPTLDVCEICE